MTQRIISIWFPKLASERAQRLRPVKGPFILTHFHKNAQRIYCLNIEAEKVGLSLGMSFADARAMYPDLISDLADPLADMSFLRVLVRWAERYCPFAAPDDRDGLLLDISGAAHLFGGERKQLFGIRQKRHILMPGDKQISG
ncbi:MAG: hypothetical protein L3J21_07220 [Devosiaceae bacterium]|nr:hypothetical protein [Devosiaceae bacterium]